MHPTSTTQPPRAGEWSACLPGVPLWVAQVELPDEEAWPADASVTSMNLAQSFARSRSAQRSRELSPPTDALRQWSDRIHRSLGLLPEHEITWRLIEYLPGQGHDAHDDLYADDTGVAVASILVCLRAPETGGQTVFGPDGATGVLVQHRAGQALCWHNVDVNGAPVAPVRHRAVPVGAGLKTVALGVVWSRQAAPPPVPPAVSGAGARPETVSEHQVGRPVVDGAAGNTGLAGLFLIMDRATDSTRLAYQAACTLRGLPLWPLDVERLCDLSVSLPAGAMLMNTSTTLQSRRVEGALLQPGVVRLTPGPPHGMASMMPVTFRQIWIRAGLEVVPKVPLVNVHRQSLHRALELVGGLPVLVEFSAPTGQPTRARVDSLSGLYSMVEHAHACGDVMDILALRPDARRWDVVVIDGEVVGAMQSVDDGGAAVDARRAAPPAVVADAAIAGAAAVGMPAGLVEIWSSTHGTELCAIRFPFEVDGFQDNGIDAAGALVGALLRRVGGAC